MVEEEKRNNQMINSFKGLSMVNGNMLKDK
jgi:hypothetical protein